MPQLETDEESSSSNLNETLSRAFGIMIRRRWWILLPACSISLIAMAVLWSLPNRYTSTATLIVVQQQVPQRYVVPNSTTDVTSALEAMKQEVLSRNQLTRMIDEFGLYPKEREHLAPERLMALMLSNIEIVPLSQRPSQREKDFDSFRISFTAEKPAVAQQVTSTLTSLFINENLRAREEQSKSTTQFLIDQVELKKKELEKHEQQLRDFKLKHVGELPEQQQGNLGILSGLQAQLQSTTNGLNQAQQQRVYLESLLAGHKRQVAAGRDVVPAPSVGSPSRAVSPLASARSEIARLEAARDSLLSRWTADHPDLLKIKREVMYAKEALRRLEAATPTGQSEESSAGGTAITSTAPKEPDEPAVSQLKSQLESNRFELQNLTKEERQLKVMIAQYQTRLNQTPIREQQQAAILRDTEALRLEYADLLKKQQESQLATSLETQQGGQQFRLVDGASLPQVPSSPKRLKMSGMGIAAGFFLGVALALLMEMKDTSFHAEKEVAQYFAAPVVLGIPVIPTPSEERRRDRTRALEWMAGSALVLLVLIAEFFIYKRS